MEVNLISSSLLPIFWGLAIFREVQQIKFLMLLLLRYLLNFFLKVIVPG